MLAEAPVPGLTCLPVRARGARLRAPPHDSEGDKSRSSPPVVLEGRVPQGEPAEEDRWSRGSCGVSCGVKKKA